MNEPAKPYLETESLTLRYGDKTALADVTRSSLAAEIV